jgi:acetoin utilization deacetylase AcuC-like enzyme
MMWHEAAVTACAQPDGTAHIGVQASAKADVPNEAAWSKRWHTWFAQAAAGALPSSGPGAIGHLDGDTAISQGSFGAALAAAGAVCRAVDAVLGGQVLQLDVPLAHAVLSEDAPAAQMVKM